MKPSIHLSLAGLGMLWLVTGACEVRGEATEISFERGCYSATQGATSTVNAQVRDETGAGIVNVKLKPILMPNADDLAASDAVLIPGTKMINTFSVEGIVSMDITPSAEIPAGREYYITLQTVDGPTISTSTLVRIQSKTESDRCAIPSGTSAQPSRL